MDRRRFLLTSLAGAIAAPLVAGAQQTEKVHRVGYLTPFELHGRYLDAFKQGLRDLGYFEGSNLVIYARSAGQRYEDLRRLAGDLVTLNVDLIVAATGVTALAAKDVTSTVPIVMAGSADAQSQGIVKSLSKPGGNVTGLTMLTSELAPKRLELLKECLPRLKTAAAMWCPQSQINHLELDRTQAAARRLSISVVPVEYTTPASWEEAADLLRKNRPDAIFLLDCPALPFKKIVEVALQSRVPMMSPYDFVTRAGGFASYGADGVAMSRRAAVFVSKILKGAKPADIPIEQPTKFELLINGKTAKTLGLTIPQSVLLRADQVIE